jgi:hypothetical protein
LILSFHCPTGCSHGYGVGDAAADDDGINGKSQALGNPIEA